jgi:2-C-methyl-D-erythritol 2,4-cyclodiphosphate synthase
MKIGHGFDAHSFQDGGKLVLGGVEIPYKKSMQAHSDGDVVIHALCDALLGAAGLRDLGTHFPDSDNSLKDIDSRILLRHTWEKLGAKNMSVGNVDVTIVAQAPRLAPYIQDMCSTIASDLGLSTDSVNIKATTTEGMGFTGRGEGIAAFAVVLLKKQ